MNSNYKYIVFSPYFGKLPAIFDLWLQSCGYNKEILFIVFTDDVYNGILPENVQIKQMKFAELQSLVQSKFDFPISLKTPYKLCDYRPAFGYIFEKYLQGCDYWGYCDLDMIFGEIHKFLPKQSYGKISHLGHLCLYRNIPEITKAFMLTSAHNFNYKDIFSSPTHFAFDENDDYGINAIFRHNKLSIYPFENFIADVNCLYHNFMLSHYQNPGFVLEYGKRIFSIENGQVYAQTLTAESIETKEYAYIHIQKRRLERIFKDTPQKYLITPAGFEPWQEISLNFIEVRQKKQSRLDFYLKKLSVKKASSPRALRRKLTIKKIELFNKFIRGK
ncbi:MAG: hypothetical protein J5594_03255 [Elusimicrobiaceae bacterium]|nr:hypothetical protein [Elusimicrobiaceae bacterium]